MEHPGLVIMGAIVTAGSAAWLGTGIVIMYRNIRRMEADESLIRPDVQ